MFDWSDLGFVAGLSGVVGLAVGWILCWTVAMNYGERTGEFRLRQRLSMKPPAVAMTLLPPGFSAARLVAQEPSAQEASEILETWADHVVVEGSTRYAQGSRSGIS